MRSKNKAIPLLIVIVTFTLTGCLGDAKESQSSTPIATTSSQPTVQPSAKPTASPVATPTATPTVTPKPSPASYESEADAKAAIENRAKETIAAIQKQDMKRLSELVHTEKGVQFTPYAFIDQKKDAKAKPKELEVLWKDSGTKNWGNYDGSGEPIQLTFQGYYKKFIYNQDFAAAKKIGYNRTIGKSTTKNNVFNLYPTNKFITVEYHFEGFDPKFQGNDWASLRLVYENYKGEWMLIAIIHDQWTV